ncbi:MAG: ribonuclease H-like domain-containing protein [Clostridium sp.]
MIVLILVEKQIPIESIIDKDVLEIFENTVGYKDAIFFDLEHYVFKKPICVGIFGAAIYDKDKKAILLTQYMIENSKDAKEILKLSKNYFETMKNTKNKKYLVSFSGNNDYIVINHLYIKNKINFDIRENFIEIDLQKVFENYTTKCIGLKNLEKVFHIHRYGELISGSNLAKIFSKINKDSGYIDRMPKEKKNNLLIYNEGDVINLFHIYATWNKYVTDETILQMKEEKQKELFQRSQYLNEKRMKKDAETTEIID